MGRVSDVGGGAMKPTQEQVIAWAREAGIPINWPGVMPYFEHFATLAYEAGQESMKWDGIHSCHPDCQRPACVHTRKAVEAEREACAKVCEDAIASISEFHPELVIEVGENVCTNLAAAIRARREQ